MCMGINNCITCLGSCCKLEIDLTKKEFLKLKSLGYEKEIIKRSELFINQYPNYLDKLSFLDNMYGDCFAILKKSKDGFCKLLDKKTRLCSIYEDRPKVCKDFSSKSQRCKNLKKCIE